MSTKQLLYNYPRYLRAMNNIRQQILVATGERTYPSGISNYSIEPPNYTNEFHSTTEEHAIRNIISQQREINELQKELRQHEIIVQAIRVSLEDLRDTERSLIELRYFKKMPWSIVASKLYISEGHAKKLNGMILEDLSKELKYIRVI